MNDSIDALQGSAISTLCLLTYDTLLVWDREVRHVWSSSWTLSKVLYLFLRYHSLAALSFYFVMSLAKTEFIIHLNIPKHISPMAMDDCRQHLTVIVCFLILPNPNLSAYRLMTKSTLIARIYIGFTEIMTMLSGEILIMIRINALYEWNRRLLASTVFLFLSEAIVGVVTTVVTLFGGSKDLAGSMDVLSCNHHTRNLSDVNIGMWCTSLIVAFIFFCLIVRRIDDISAETTHNNRLPAIVQVFLWCPSVAPTLYCCLRDGALYFVLIFSVLSFNLVLTATQTSYALIGTPWLIAIYAIASTRIFLNLRELCNSPQRFAGATWSEFQEASAVEFRILESAGTLVEP